MSSSINASHAVYGGYMGTTINQSYYDGIKHQDDGVKDLIPDKVKDVNGFKEKAGYVARDEQNLLYDAQAVANAGDDAGKAKAGAERYKADLNQYKTDSANALEAAVSDGSDDDKAQRRSYLDQAFDFVGGLTQNMVENKDDKDGKAEGAIYRTSLTGDEKDGYQHDYEQTIGDIYRGRGADSSATSSGNSNGGGNGAGDSDGSNGITLGQYDPNGKSNVTAGRTADFGKTVDDLHVPGVASTDAVASTVASGGTTQVNAASTGRSAADQASSWLDQLFNQK